MRIPVNERDVHAHVADLRHSFPRLKDHELFLVWFLQAIVTEDVNAAASALTGNSKDKGADAVLIDDPAKAVVVVQGKYHKKVSHGTESRPDLISFAQLARDLHGSEDDFKALRKEVDPRVNERLGDARECLKKRGYHLKLYFVTTARCSAALKHEAEQTCRRADGPSDIEIFDGKRVLVALTDYLDGVVPPVPSLDLPLELGHGITSECHRRHDSRNNMTSWLFSMNGISVAEMYESAGIRLFARNVRGFLGANTPVNVGMEETIRKEPWNFWYYNNGITMICDRVQRISVGGKDVMRVSNPQVINGQQTTRTLHASAKGHSPAAVLVRAIEVPRDIQNGTQGFDSLVSKIVAATFMVRDASSSTHSIRTGNGLSLNCERWSSVVHALHEMGRSC